jgi:cephalosporin-C deacetylase-like acetyl esterase
VRDYDSVNFAPRLRRQVLFTLSVTDRICPPPGVSAAFHQLKTTKVIWNYLDAGHVSRPDYEAGFSDEVLAYVRSSNSP